ncbi:MAG: hypothetical protein BA863_18555 [Desulfovibrio sp. S3730MH75]|nr:MAG: hypothetical protein BA863_18555 [Desulfovibrio sp. S3730MH75]
MKLDIKDDPRCFSPTETVTLKDFGTIVLEPNEQLTFETEEGKRHDLTRKEWGWYLSNSVNASLKGQGYKTALVMSLFAGEPRIFINVVEEDKLDIFFDYIEKNKTKLICWLDEWADTSARG